MTKSPPPDKPFPGEVDGDTSFVTNSVLYKELLAEREEILRHKWLESEKAGHDIGFEKALLDWILKHRSSWHEKRRDHHRVVSSLSAAGSAAAREAEADARPAETAAAGVGAGAAAGPVAGPRVHSAAP